MKTPNMIIGQIMLWWGAVETIPSGWHLCNGKMNTPDLRNKFVVGAGDTHDPDDTGGSAVHTHNIQAGTDIDAGTYRKTELLFKSNAPPYHALCFIMKVN